MNSLRNQLSKKILNLPNTEKKVFNGKNGELISFLYKNKEFAHFHNNNVIDIRLTKRIIQQEDLKHPSKSENHPKRSLSSPWIELQFNNKKEIALVFSYIQLAIEQIK